MQVPSPCALVANNLDVDATLNLRKKGKKKQEERREDVPRDILKTNARTQDPKDPPLFNETTLPNSHFLSFSVLPPLFFTCTLAARLCLMQFPSGFIRLDQLFGHTRSTAPRIREGKLSQPCMPPPPPPAPPLAIN